MSEQRIPLAISHPVHKGPAPKPRPLCLTCGKTCVELGRRYCSMACYRAHNQRRRREQADPSPLSDSPVTPVSVDPSNAQDHPRRTRQPLCAPKPPPTGLTTIKKKPADYPAVDPALCTFPARTPIWVSDGAAIVADLHAHRPICASLVRGWASTTADGTEGYRTPCFETAAGAALWDAICDHKLGRREGRMS